MSNGLPPWSDPEHDIMADLLAAKAKMESDYDNLPFQSAVPCTCYGHEYGDDPRCPLHYGITPLNTATDDGS